MPAPDRPDTIRQFILEYVSDHPGDITRLTTGQFGISRQMAARYLRALVDEGLLEATGNTKGRNYRLRTLVDEAIWLDVPPDFPEDTVWRQEIAPLLHGLPPNARAICQHGVTALLANVRDHSGSDSVYVAISTNALQASITIGDSGAGIFSRIQQDFHLDSPQDAPLELAKGKLTSDEHHHSGDSVLFTSRLFDRVTISSGKLVLRHTANEDDWLLEDSAGKNEEAGTVVVLEILAATARTAADVLRRYTTQRGATDAASSHVPVKLARHGNDDLLVSRSQARRVLARLDRFSEVILDFRDIPSIGQAFADEVFRVFRNDHPDVKLSTVNASTDVQRMVRHVTAMMTEYQRDIL